MVPVLEISRAEIEVVDCEIEVDVEMKKEDPIDLNFQISSVIFPTRANCDCEVEAIVNRAPAVVRVVVPTPKAPVKKESDVVVEMREPTVS